MNGAVYSLQYDVLNDATGVVDCHHGYRRRKTLPATDLALVAWLKANPDKASAGGAGTRREPRGDGLLQNQTGTRFQSVPYRGSIAMQDLLAGQIDLIFDLAASAVL